MIESLPSLITSSGNRGWYVRLGGVTDAIDADSTMVDGWGTPPLSFAGTYGTNTVLLAWALSSLACCWLEGLSMVRRGIVLRAAHASSTLPALPQVMWLSCHPRCKLAAATEPHYLGQCRQ